MEGRWIIDNAEGMEAHFIMPQSSEDISPGAPFPVVFSDERGRIVQVEVCEVAVAWSDVVDRSIRLILQKQEAGLRQDL